MRFAVKLLVVIICSVVSIISTGCSRNTSRDTEGEVLQNKRMPADAQMHDTHALGEKKKVLYLNSYHLGFEWVNDIYNGILKELDIKPDAYGDLDCSQSSVDLRVFHMDTKRNQEEEYKKQKAVEAKKLIEEWQPDVVIASDDNASKYLIMPYFIGTDVSFVFCGVNWDCSLYGFPSENITGVLEVTLLPQLVNLLRPYADGARIAILSSDTLSEHRNIEYYQKAFSVPFDSFFVNTFHALKESFITLQQEYDILILTEIASVEGFNHDEMVAFVQAKGSVLVFKYY